MVDRRIVFKFSEALRRSDLERLTALAGARLAGGETRLLVIDVAGLRADAVALDAIARLVLAAHRHGCPVKLHGTCGEMEDLLELSGLNDLLGR